MAKSDSNKRRTPKSRGAPTNIRAAQRRQDAVTLRIEGLAYAEIAKRLGYKDESGARKAVNEALKQTGEETAEHADELRSIEDARTNFWHSRLVAAVQEPDNEGVSKLASSAMAVLTRRAKLHGLDKPAQFELTNPDADKGIDLSGWLPDELAEYEKIVSAFEALGARVQVRLEEEKNNANNECNEV